MVRLFRWLLGSVKFKFFGGFAQGFVNDCFNEKINVHNLKTESDALYGLCSAKTYKSLHRIALKNGGKVQMVKKSGPVFLFLKIKNRWGLFAGMIAFIAIINFLSGFIWSVEIYGNEKISTAQLVEFLNENDFHEGVYWNNVEKSSLENLIMASFDDCAWVHINRFGSTARVEISEAVEKPDIADNSKYTNVKAVKDGIIVKATVFSGYPVAKIGDGVSKGDLLISGIYESEINKKNLFTHAGGEYIAMVKEPFALTINRQQSYKAYSDEREKKYICFFGLEIPLFIDFEKDKSNYDISTEYKYIKLNKKEIPVGIRVDSIKPYTKESRVLSDKELNRLVAVKTKEKLSSDYAGIDIVGRHINTSLEADKAVCSGYIECLENIGEEVEIKISKSKHNKG